MLDVETKRRIDMARDLLVGKVPDPKSQVEQITIALIYKFMDDMDRETVEFGGERQFFAGEFGRYSWENLKATQGGQDKLNLYMAGMASMGENPGIPSLFRDIFKNAFLPYRDPETLREFLKIIDEFHYDHSENLGNAFEYLLSVLGSQGDAGQFRTPRHIIDFMVGILRPQKREKILDPACGTAGFLISAYKYIVAQNQDGEGRSLLTPDDRGILARNIWGYDISPDMVRLSLVNLYLHGFRSPQVVEYDTLTSEERWGEFADVILANPPFMSPTGGIKPHKRFSVQSKRSEVLFVDYILEHLTPIGRAGIIVPEGIIFQSQTAYKQLRKLLVERFLVAVVSLPAGVFQPYSGVKTSILIVDRALAIKSGFVGFFKVENDGFGLGAQRRSIEANDLPGVAGELGEFLERLRSGQGLEGFEPRMGLIVSRERIGENGEFNLSGERYREDQAYGGHFPMTQLSDSSLFRVESGGTPSSQSEELWNGGIPWVTLADLPASNFITEIHKTVRNISAEGLKKSSAKLIDVNSVLVSTRATIGRIAINRVPLATNQGFKNIIIQDHSRILSEYVALTMTRLVPIMEAWATGGTFKEISKSKFCELEIPLPPIEVQREIVAEIEGYQKVIDGARAVVENYRPQIAIDPEWPIVKIGEVFAISYGIAESIPENLDPDGIRIISTAEVKLDGSLDLSNIRCIISRPEYSKFILKPDTLLFNWRNAPKHVGKTAVFDQDNGSYVFASFLLALTKKETGVNHKFVWVLLNRLRQEGYFLRMSRQAVNQTNFNASELAKVKIPLPPLEIQNAIVAEIETEQRLVNANRELITRFQQKIQTTLDRIWGQPTP